MEKAEYQINGGTELAIEHNAERSTRRDTECGTENPGRIHKVGTITCGLMFVLYGVLFLLRIVWPKLDYRTLFELWPLILIALGVEILASSMRKNQEKRKIVYDFPAILIVMFLALFVMVMAAINYGMSVSREWTLTNPHDSYDYHSSYFPQYEAADRTETLPADSDDNAIHKAIAVPAGEGSVKLNLPDIKEPVADNWPESISCVSDGMCAEAYKIPITIEEPVELFISCVTEAGNLNMWIEDADGRKYFNEKNLQTDDYSAAIDKAGTYTVVFEAEYYYGGFVITPQTQSPVYPGTF